MKQIFVMPSGIEFLKEVGTNPPIDYRIAIPRSLRPMNEIDYDDETYLLADNSAHLVFEYNRQKTRYEYKYMI